MKNKSKVCQDCEKEKPDVEERECPFALEIYNEKVIVTICDECCWERAQDI